MRLPIASVVLALLLAGCATDPAVKSYWTLTETSFAPIKPGVTDKSAVRNLVGKAIAETTFLRQGEEIWDYRYLDGTRVYIAEVHFDLNGKTKYTTYYLDPAYHATHLN